MNKRYMENRIRKFMQDKTVLDRGFTATFFKMEIGIGNNDIVLVADNEATELESIEFLNLVENYTEKDVDDLYTLFDGNLSKYVLFLK